MSSWQFEAAVDTSKVTFQLDSHIAKSQAAILVHHILCLIGTHPWTVDQCYMLQKENNMKRYSWEGTVPKPKQIQFFSDFWPAVGLTRAVIQCGMSNDGSQVPLSPSLLVTLQPAPWPPTILHPSFTFNFLHPPLPQFFSPLLPQKEKKKKKKGIMLKK